MDRYELQSRYGNEWLNITSSDHIGKLKPWAQNITADYRVIDHCRSLVRALDVTIFECLLSSGGWQAYTDEEESAS